MIAAGFRFFNAVFAVVLAVLAVGCLITGHWLIGICDGVLAFANLASLATSPKPVCR